MESLTRHDLFAVGVVALLAYWDIRYRVAPNWLTIPLFVLGVIAGSPWSALFAVGIGMIMAYADFPGGDVKGAAAIAVWVPYPIFIPAFAVTLIMTVVIMETGWYNLYHRAHRWAWLAGLSFALTISAICRRLIGT